MHSTTAVRFVAIKDVAIPPAIAEVTTALGETFPIFDVATLCRAREAMAGAALVLPMLSDSLQCRLGYLRTFRHVDANAQTMPCPWCHEAEHPADKPVMMQRHEAGENNGSVPQFACPRCHHRIYLAPIPPTAAPRLPTQARARLDRATDGLFALDHLHHTATLMDSFNAAAPLLRPFRGVAAQLEPFRESHALDALGLLTARDLTLRLTGDPFHGRTSYQVL